MNRVLIAEKALAILESIVANVVQYEKSACAVLLVLSVDSYRQVKLPTPPKVCRDWRDGCE